MIKILFLINSLELGGAEKALVDLVNNMNQNEFDITVQTVFNKGIYKGDFTTGIKYKTINRIENVFLRKLFTFVFIDVLPLSVIYRCFVRDEYDYEVAFLEGLTTKILSNSSDKSTKKIGWVHTDLGENFYIDKYFKTHQDLVKCYQTFEKIVCVSEASKNGLVKIIGNDPKIIVRYNVLDDELIRIKGIEEDAEVNDHHGFTLVAVGRLNPGKAFDRLIEAHRVLLNEGIKQKLWIVGEGMDRDKLMGLIDKYQLNDSVTLFGAQRNPYKYIKAADLFICSSLYEGLSNVVTESIILGTPVLTTDCAGMRELLGDSEYGLIVENNTVGLHEGIKKMITDPVLYQTYKRKAETRSKDFGKFSRLKNIEDIFKNL